MLILGIDTATRVATAAIIKDEQLLGETYVHTDNKHSRHLMPLIEGLLNLCQVQLKELDGIAVALGPGSFTGLRIGLATGKGLVSALEIPLVGIPTLDGLAWNLAGVEGIVCPILDARKKQVYAGMYTWAKSEGKMVKVNDYMALTPTELAEKIVALEQKGPIHFLGDGVPVYRQELNMLLAGKEVYFSHQPNSLARGAQIAWLGLERLKKDGEQGVLADFHNLAPIYLRASEAEVNLKNKNLAEKRC